MCTYMYSSSNTFKQMGSDFIGKEKKKKNKKKNKKTKPGKDTMIE